MAFAPVDHPKIAIACIIEHSGHGGSTAAPVVKAVMEKYFELNPPQGGTPVIVPGDSQPVDPLAD
jgi:penicillin-binding protein 2